jgi:hypothetical protein
LSEDVEFAEVAAVVLGINVDAEFEGAVGVAVSSKGVKNLSLDGIAMGYVHSRSSYAEVRCHWDNDLQNSRRDRWAA